MRKTVSDCKKPPASSMSGHFTKIDTGNGGNSSTMPVFGTSSTTVDVTSPNTHKELNPIVDKTDISPIKHSPNFKEAIVTDTLP